MLLGIYGQIGSGKSEVARLFQKLGAYIISADLIGKEVVEKDQRVLKKLAKTFGDNILTPTGKLRRRKLGEIALASEENKNKLNKIVHPYLLKELSRKSKEASRKYNIVIIDAALLIDWGWDKKVDKTILVHAGDKVKISRLIKKGYSPKEALMRIKAQLKYSDLRNHADIVVFNNRSLESLKKRVEKIFNKLT